MPENIKKTLLPDEISKKSRIEDKDDNYYDGDLYKIFMSDIEIPEILKKWIEKLESKALDEEFGNLPLYKLAERIISDFKLQNVKGDWPFIEAFLDIVLEYTRNESSDLSTFLDWWGAVGYRKTINTPEEQDAIKVLTIHKSKGLEFKVVIVPFCDWPLYPEATKAPLLWCKPEKEPFNKLDLVPVRWKKELNNSYFCREYFNEMLYTAIDNMNLLYVAFTRAINSLYIYAPYVKSIKDSGKKVSSLLQYIVENPPLLDSVERARYIDISEHWNPNELKFVMGEEERGISRVEHSVASETEPLTIVDSSDELKIRIHSKNFIMLKEAEWQEKINYGNLVHEVFEKIETEKDISRVMKSMEFEGKISSYDAKNLYEGILKMMKDERVRSWFSGEWEVLNERDILRGDSSRHRPDRVMIKGDTAVVVDYKTGEESEKYRYQVEKYMNDLKKMGYSKISGFILYINDNNLVEI
jgi:ATP-dependent exoDNAse (exonuclease V) beta subunit